MSMCFTGLHTCYQTKLSSEAEIFKNVKVFEKLSKVGAPGDDRFNARKQLTELKTREVQASVDDYILNFGA